ncbi:hypothetical protein PHYPSEUDO_004669 [Phytophthora pseudosyringae]|uniref:Uncharacterized protein n=1 Tax=Phytophthora pseudosyringae TaxID=221518 RepID=A0A8T1VQW9_9STRA|nr:hypothetical protein PHYPSEUDO_004669 [Phytophthora pseudosyringae]
MECALRATEELRIAADAMNDRLSRALSLSPLRSHGWQPTLGALCGELHGRFGVCRYLPGQTDKRAAYPRSVLGGRAGIGNVTGPRRELHQDRPIALAGELDYLSRSGVQILANVRTGSEFGADLRQLLLRLLSSRATVSRARLSTA